MARQKWTTEPIEPVKEIRDFNPISSMEFFIPHKIENILSESVKQKVLYVLHAHMHSVEKRIIENHHRNREEKRQWHADQMRIQDRIRPFVNFTWQKKNFFTATYSTNFLNSL